MDRTFDIGQPGARFGLFFKGAGREGVISGAGLEILVLA